MSGVASMKAAIARNLLRADKNERSIARSYAALAGNWKRNARSQSETKPESPTASPKQSPEKLT